MKAMKTLLAAALLAVSAAAKAQATYTDANETRYVFKKHMFVDLQGGVQFTRGEAKFRKLISPNFQIGLGYQFSPIVSARLQANAYRSKGGWNGYGPLALTKDYEFFYTAPGIDVMFNLSNLIGGYNPTRFFDLSAFIGGGANIAWHNGQVNGIADDLAYAKNDYLLEYVWRGTKVRPFGRAGLEAAFRLNDYVAFTIEGNANILSDKYNSKKAGNPDWYFNALAGFRINLCKPHTKMVKEIVTVTEPIQAETKIEYITKRDTVYVSKPEALQRNVFFEINKWEIRPTEEQKVQDVANYLKKYPNARVSLCGYADVKTGNESINDHLGQQRVEAVRDALVNQYGISASRISTDSKGSRVQPFAINEQNRVTICVAE